MTRNTNILSVRFTGQSVTFTCDIGNFYRMEDRIFTGERLLQIWTKQTATEYTMLLHEEKRIEIEQGFGSFQTETETESCGTEGFDTTTYFAIMDYKTGKSRWIREFETITFRNIANGMWIVTVIEYNKQNNRG